MITAYQNFGERGFKHFFSPFFNNASSLKQVHGWTYRSTRTHYFDSEPTCLCSFP